MSRLTLTAIIVFCVFLVVLPIWTSLHGVGVSGVASTRDEQGNVRYVHSRSWVGGGPSRGK